MVAGYNLCGGCLLSGERAIEAKIALLAVSSYGLSSLGTVVAYRTRVLIGHLRACSAVETCWTNCSVCWVLVVTIETRFTHSAVFLLWQLLIGAGFAEHHELTDVDNCVIVSSIGWVRSWASVADRAVILARV